MTIHVQLDVLLAMRRMKSKQLAAAINISEQNLSLLKQGKVKGMRFDTLDALCQALQCQPGDLLRHSPPVPPAASQPDVPNIEPVSAG